MLISHVFAILNSDKRYERNQLVKTFKFKIIEFWIGGIKEPRFIEIKARTQQSAEKKVRQIQGNREWTVEFMGVA